nr:hypothetical protein Hi04_10k_c4003_00019 [uncultured bacterium]
MNKRCSAGLSRAILTDVHFWVPVVVLVWGLLVLRWIS